MCLSRPTADADPNQVLESQYGLRKLLDMPAATPPLSAYLLHPDTTQRMLMAYQRTSDQEWVACKLQYTDVAALFKSSAAALSSKVTDTHLAAVLGVGRNLVLDVGDRSCALLELFTSDQGVEWASQVGVQATIFADKKGIDHLSDSLHEANEKLKIRLKQLDVVDWTSPRIKLVPVDTGHPSSLYNLRQGLLMLRDGTGVITFFRDSLSSSPRFKIITPPKEAIFCHDPKVVPVGTFHLDDLVDGRDTFMRGHSFAVGGPQAPATSTSARSGTMTRST